MAVRHSTVQRFDYHYTFGLTVRDLPLHKVYAESGSDYSVYELEAPTQALWPEALHKIHISLASVAFR